MAATLLCSCDEGKLPRWAESNPISNFSFSYVGYDLGEILLGGNLDSIQG
jgi:hypothetical protein